MQREKPNYRRELINTENLMPYLDIIPDKKFSLRNKDIVRRYMNGESYKTIALHYGVTSDYIPQVIRQFIYHCHRIINNT